MHENTQRQSNITQHKTLDKVRVLISLEKLLLVHTLSMNTHQLSIPLSLGADTIAETHVYACTCMTD